MIIAMKDNTAAEAASVSHTICVTKCREATGTMLRYYRSSYSQPRPRHRDSALVAIGKLVKGTGSDIYICRLTAST